MCFDVVIIGAGASGLMCALRAAGRGRDVLLMDHRRDFGQKVLISGGGHCNFTNIDMHAGAYLSSNPHFVKSALARFTPSDFTSLLDRYDIPYREKSAGQLFLKGSSKRVFDMLISEVKASGARISIGRVVSIRKKECFRIHGSSGEVEARKVVIATGGLSYPKLGASDFGYRVAKKFGHGVVTCRPALVPLLFSPQDLGQFSKLSGISFRARVGIGKYSVLDDCLITHRGFSGPAILRISSRWTRGNSIMFDLLPDVDVLAEMLERRGAGSRVQLRTLLSRYLPDRLASMLCEKHLSSRPLKEYSIEDLRSIDRMLHRFTIVPRDTEGYKKAEVTAGGIATDDISSKAMESKLCPGLYFIGEVLDVTGDLGGYNLHWAWASGNAAGLAV